MQVDDLSMSWYTNAVVEVFFLVFICLVLQELLKTPTPGNRIQYSNLHCYFTWFLDHHFMNIGISPELPEINFDIRSILMTDLPLCLF